MIDELWCVGGSGGGLRKDRYSQLLAGLCTLLTKKAIDVDVRISVIPFLADVLNVSPGNAPFFRRSMWSFHLPAVSEHSNEDNEHGEYIHTYIVVISVRTSHPCIVVSNMVGGSRGA